MSTVSKYDTTLNTCYQMRKYGKDGKVEELIKTVQLYELDDDPELLPGARTLLEEYGNYMFSDLKLIAGKQGFYEHLKQFPGNAYAPPSGTFTVAKTGDKFAGCVGIKKFEKGSCEMKRLYVRQAYRGLGIGRLLCNFVIEWCRKAGYSRILLDSNIEMKEAVKLYRESGFTEIDAYCINENDHPIFMEYIL